MLFPRPDTAALTAVLLNTAGGLTGGDRFSVSATAADGSRLTLTTQAAERVYRALPGTEARLTPREKDKLLIAMAAGVARKRLARGVLLNYPEAIALISDHVVEGARDGRSVAEMMEAGAKVISRKDCMAGVPEMIRDVQVEAAFPDGTKLVTVHDPIR